MHDLLVATKLGTLLLLLGLTSTVFWQILTGKISARRLLRSRTDPDRVDVSKCQLLSVTVATAFIYILEASKNPLALPAIPTPLLYVSGGSNLFFLVSKFIQCRTNNN